MEPSEIVKRVMEREFPGWDCYINGPHPAAGQMTIQVIRVYLELNDKCAVDDNEPRTPPDRDLWEERATAMAMTMKEQMAENGT